MTKTHKFTKNDTGNAVEVVVNKIIRFEHDTFSECTAIYLEGGDKIFVSESLEQVSTVVNDS